MGSPGTTTDYLALDLGAESGRGVVGRFDGARLTLNEVRRFPNGPVRAAETLYWDALRLFDEMKATLGQASRDYPGLEGVGIDTWGVDFALLGRHDTWLGNPVHYRDPRTAGMTEHAASLVPLDRIYEVTGLQFLPFNSIYQLLAMRRADSPLLDTAETLLMMPDLFGWLFTGRKGVERTNASTTQLYDPRADGGRGAWSDELCAALDLPRPILPGLIDPGTELGPLRPSVADELGIARPLTVLAPGTHDTASAVAAVPARGGTGQNPPDWCYLSSGTWSLLGVEVPRPVITPATRAANFTNEAGVAGTTRLLKNIMGLWLVQECRRTWLRAGDDLSYDALIARAGTAAPFRTLVDPDDPSFFPPGDMPARIAAFARRTGQPVPEDEGAFVRCALESLALKYRQVIARLEGILGTTIRTVHVVGGGCRNALLNQFAADACGVPVLAGPVEATAAGNILLQAIARGRLADLAEARAVVAASFPIDRYDPDPRAAARWAEALGRFNRIAPTLAT